MDRQLRACDKVIKECIEIARVNGIPFSQEGLRIDSHRHTHHIPIVWRAIRSVLKRRGMRVEYIRCAKEPLSVFSVFGCRPVNIIKNLVLNVYSPQIDRYITKNGLEKMYLLGIVMSGEMYENRVKRVLPLLMKKAEKDGRNIEILFHPGRALENEDRSGLDRKAENDFYLSINRSLEKKALKDIGSMEIIYTKRLCYNE